MNTSKEKEAYTQRARDLLLIVVAESLEILLHQSVRKFSGKLDLNDLSKAAMHRGVLLESMDHFAKQIDLKR